MGNQLSSFLTGHYGEIKLHKLSLSACTHRQITGSCICLFRVSAFLTVMSSSANMCVRSTVTALKAMLLFCRRAFSEIEVKHSCVFSPIGLLECLLYFLPFLVQEEKEERITIFMRISVFL